MLDEFVADEYDNARGQQPLAPTATAAAPREFIATVQHRAANELISYCNYCYHYHHHSRAAPERDELWCVCVCEPPLTPMADIGVRLLRPSGRFSIEKREAKQQQVHPGSARVAWPEGVHLD